MNKVVFERSINHYSDPNQHKKQLSTFFMKVTMPKKKGEKHQCVVASHMPPTGDLTHKPRMRPDWESNQWPFGSQASTQSTEPHQPGQNIVSYLIQIIIFFVLTAYFNYT